MVKCPDCGVEIRYIPSGFTKFTGLGVFIVESEEKELITDSGRVVKGHPRHQCQKKTREEENERH